MYNKSNYHFKSNLDLFCTFDLVYFYYTKYGIMFSMDGQKDSSDYNITLDA